jgi:putative membrane protein
MTPPSEDPSTADDATPHPANAADAGLRETLRVPSVADLLSTFLVGVFMGSADAVPGVSGGTIALIAGVYERLIAAITALTPRRAWRAVGVVFPTGDGVLSRDAVDAIEELDAWFLAALGTGVVVAVVTVTRVVHWGIVNEPTLLYGGFFGLIAASAVILLREADVDDAATAGSFAAGTVVAFLVAGASETFQAGGLLVVFGAGAIAVSAMILPGISGSLLLVLLGQYERMSGALSTFTSALADAVSEGVTDVLVDSGVVVVTFVAGGLVGLLTVSRAVRRALDWHHAVTVAFLVGLVVGALRAPVERVASEVGFGPDVTVAFALAAVVGAVAVLVLDHYAVDVEL